MKNIIKLFVCIFLILLTCGCGRSYTCSSKYKDNIKYKLKVKFDLDKDKKVTSSLAVLTFNNNDDASEFCKVEKVLSSNLNITCTNKTVRIKNYHTILKTKEEITKEEIINILKADGLKCR